MAKLRLFLASILVVALAACGGGGGHVRRAPVGGGGAGTWVGGTVPQLGDAAPHAWRGGHPYNHEVHGIDISRWQGGIDWNRVRTSGVSFAYIKATEGADHVDPMFQTYFAQAGAARMPRGGYHYYYFCRSGAEQAAWYIRNVPRQPGMLPPVLDIEWTHSRTCPRRPGSAEILSEANTFLNILEAHYGQRPVIYTTVDFYRDSGIGRLNAEFWLRSVADHPRNTYRGQRWTFWQYTGTGIVPGIGGKVDLNAFAGNANQWRAWLNRRLVR